MTQLRILQDDMEILGLAVEDLAAAYHVYQEARARGLGTVVDFGGTRVEDATA